MTRAYLTGRRYEEEKKFIGYNQHDKTRVPHSEEAKSTGKRIADQMKVGHATVERSAKFAQAVDTICYNTNAHICFCLGIRLKNHYLFHACFNKCRS